GSTNSSIMEAEHLKKNIFLPTRNTLRPCARPDADRCQSRTGTIDCDRRPPLSHAISSKHKGPQGRRSGRIHCIMPGRTGNRLTSPASCANYGGCCANLLVPGAIQHGHCAPYAGFILKSPPSPVKGKNSRWPRGRLGRLLGRLGDVWGGR